MESPLKQNQQKFKEILLNVHNKAHSSKEIKVKEIINEIKEEILSLRRD